MIFWIDKLVLSGSDWSESSLSLTTSIARWVGMQVNSDTLYRGEGGGDEARVFFK